MTTLGAAAFPASSACAISSGPVSNFPRQPASSSIFCKGRSSVGRTKCQSASSSSSAESSFKPTPDEVVSVDIQTISSESQFDVALADSPQRAVIVNWMAAWCRKCIYLKPKLEKLAAEYPNVKFYSVDVNEVSQSLVRRADVTKMPTIQLWKDGKKQDEVIGGHKAWVVINEVREMLENHNGPVT